jgi:hypothetical protein
LVYPACAGKAHALSHMSEGVRKLPSDHVYLDSPLFLDPSPHRPIRSMLGQISGNHLKSKFYNFQNPW